MSYKPLPNLSDYTRPFSFGNLDTTLPEWNTQQIEQPGQQSSVFGNAFGANGWGLPAIQGLGGLAQSWLGFKQLGLAKDQFNFQKDAFTQNYNMQAQTMNRQLEDRQRARLSANPNGYQSVGEYMSKNEVKPYGG